jgi:HlyD family secretion protein
MKRPSLKLIVILIVVAGIAVLAWWSTTRPVEVAVAEVVRGTIRSSVEEEGKTRVTERYVVSAPVSGRLLRVDLEEDDEVAKGQVLATIDSIGLTSQIEEAKARITALKRQIEGADRKRPKEEELTRAKLLEETAAAAIDVAEREREEAAAAAEQARREVERAADLFAKRTISSSEKETADLAYTRAQETLRAREKLVKIRMLELDAAKLGTKILEETARDVDWEEEYYRAQIEAIDAGLAAVRDDLERTVIRAPADGKVLALHQESETVVVAGTPILEIGDVTKLEVEADFLSEDVAHMRIGMAVEFTGRALGDAVVPGRITRIYPSAFEKVSSLGVEQQRVMVVASFEDGPPGLGDGFRVDVRVILQEKEDVLLAPGSALFRSPDGGWSAFRLKEGRVELVEVATGIRDQQSAEILEGLEAGDLVVTYPDPDLEDGARAKRVEAD